MTNLKSLGSSFQDASSVTGDSPRERLVQLQLPLTTCYHHTNKRVCKESFCTTLDWGVLSKYLCKQFLNCKRVLRMQNMLGKKKFRNTLQIIVWSKISYFIYIITLIKNLLVNLEFTSAWSSDVQTDLAKTTQHVNGTS